MASDRAVKAFKLANVAIGVCACGLFALLGLSPGYFGDSHSQWSYIFVPLLTLPVLAGQAALAIAIIATERPSLSGMAKLLIGPLITVLSATAFLIETYVGLTYHHHGSGC